MIGSLHFQQISRLSYIHRSRGAYLDHDSFGLMDVSAEKVRGLVLLDELADGAAAAVEAFFDTVERGV